MSGRIFKLGKRRENNCPSDLPLEDTGALHAALKISAENDKDQLL